MVTIPTFFFLQIGVGIGKVIGFGGNAKDEEIGTALMLLPSRFKLLTEELEEDIEETEEIGFSVIWAKEATGGKTKVKLIIVNTANAQSLLSIGKLKVYKKKR